MRGKSDLYSRSTLGHLKLSAEEARKLRKATEQRYCQLCVMMEDLMDIRLIVLFVMNFQGDVIRRIGVFLFLSFALEFSFSDLKYGEFLNQPIMNICILSNIHKISLDFKHCA